MNRSYLIALAIVAVVAGAGLVFPAQRDAVIQTVAENVGVSSGNEFQDSIIVNGVERAYRKMSLQQATTTICALKSPSATSTLRAHGLNINVSSTSASIITIAKATTAFATTTQIGSDIPVAANEKVTITGSTSPASGYGNLIFAPNTYLTVGMKGGSGTFSPSGSCQAEFEIVGK